MPSVTEFQYFFLLKLQFCYWNFHEILAKILKFVLISQLFPHKNTDICVKLCKNTEIITICYWSEFPGVGSPVYRFDLHNFMANTTCVDQGWSTYSGIITFISIAHGLSLFLPPTAMKRCPRNCLVGAWPSTEILSAWKDVYCQLSPSSNTIEEAYVSNQGLLACCQTS